MGITDKAKHEVFLMPFLNIDAAERVFIFTQQKTDAGTSKLEQYFFLNLYFDVISPNIIQVRP